MYFVVMYREHDIWVIGKSSSYEFCEECETVVSEAYKKYDFEILSDNDPKFISLDIKETDDEICEIITYVLPDDDEVFYLPLDLTEYLDEVLVNLETTIRIGLENLMEDLSIFKKKNDTVDELKKKLKILYKDFNDNYENGEKLLPYKIKIEKLIKYSKYY